MQGMCLLVLLIVSVGNGWAEPGVLVVPDERGSFTYEDDFSTPKCLTDAFLLNTGVEVWQSGTLQHRGPDRNRMLVYRFYGPRVISGLAVTVEQTSNARYLGGRTDLYLSRNGLDWTQVASSATQPGDANAWQSEPFALTPEQTTAFTGGTEVWLRLAMDNYSGLQTNVSNIIRRLRVELTVGGEPEASADPQAALADRWGRLRRQAGWRTLTLDAADPVAQRAPHYYEDADGWLRAPGESPHLRTDENAGFRVQRVYVPEGRSPLSLVAFVRTGAVSSPCLARITVQAERDATRRLEVRWDGQTVATHDTASFIARRAVLYAELPVSPPGIHELRLVPGDQGSLLVQEIAVAGPSALAWAERPALPSAPPLALLSAAYLPDPPPPAASQAVEGRQAVTGGGPVFAGLQRFYQGHAEFGALRVLLRNAGDVPVRIGDQLLLDGRPVEQQYVDFTSSDWDARGVVWYRVRPRLLNPGQCAEVYVRFRKRPDGEAAALTIPCVNAPPTTVSIRYREPGAALDFVTTDRTRAVLYAYVRTVSEASEGTVAALALDGKLLREATVHGTFADGVVLVTARLPQPLSPMSYHVVTARTTSDEVVGGQFRVLPWFLPRSSIHVPSELCAEMSMNLGMWHHRSLEECRRYDLWTTTNEDRMFDAHERIRYIMGPDEPDAKDNRGGGYDRGLGYEARRLADSGWAELVQSQAPEVATWIIMDGTTRPLNWCVYGQFADISCFDPYPINFYGADHAYVRESLQYARLCGAPRPMYACLEAFGWSAGQGVPGNRRGPTPAEWRQNVVQAIGSGAKGFTSWVYSAGAGGWQINEEVRQEIAHTCALVARMEDLLLLGVPVPWAMTDAGTVPTGVAGDERWPKERVWAGALLCGPDAIVVAVANHIPASKPEPPTIEPGRDVIVTVRLPAYLPAVTATEVTEDGERPLPCEVTAGQVHIRLDRIDSGRVLVLRRQS